MDPVGAAVRPAQRVAAGCLGFLAVSLALLALAGIVAAVVVSKRRTSVISDEAPAPATAG